ncbi:MAG: hypothetical protein QW645_06055, partial [Candidatus Bathyarchaeia archaeon]
MAEFSASAFTAPIQAVGRVFYGGNRDCPWQGLLVGPIGGALYKTIDAIYFSIPGVALEAKDVIIGRGFCRYRYGSKELGEISHKVSLRSSPGRILLEASVGRPCWFAVILDPRPAEAWGEGPYEVEPNGGTFIIKPSAIPLRIIIDGFDKPEPLGLMIEWRYKLGEGFRRNDSGNMRFVEIRRTVSIPAMFFSNEGSLRINIPLPPALQARSPPAFEPRKLRLGRGPVAEALRLRFMNLASFSIYASGIWFPEAGAWWFRRPWTRDALEGIRWNLKSYFEILEWGGEVVSLIGHLLDALKALGGLPSMMGGNELASDAVPQLFNVAWRVAAFYGGRDLLLKSVKVAEFVAERLLREGEISRTVLRDSILCNPANSSWIDSVIDLGDKRWPTRLPVAWADQGVDPFSSEYGMVEVNALYIEALNGLRSTCDQFGLSSYDEIEELLDVLREGFIRYFKGGDAPPLTVSPSHRLVDPTFGSPAVVAAAALGPSLCKDRLLRIWRAASERLLVQRRLVVLGKGRLPFGILVRDLGSMPYMGDWEYHGPTIWPRDTPYLLRLMEGVGMDVKGLLLNNLDHMVAEGAVGYCNELFSLPVGGNPSAGPESENPIPVKNPAQYWSHWCDPFLERLPELL